MITVVGNLKGGTGKSTVAFNLAIWVATRCQSGVSVYDLDPQATLSDAFEIREEEGYQPIIQPLTEIALLGQEKNDTEVIIDIGMSDITSMKQALAQADRVIIPVAPSQADVWSTQRFLKIIKEACKTKNLPERLVFINRADTHPKVRETAETREALNMLSEITVLDVCLYQRTIYRRSFSEGQAVFEMEARSKATQEIEKLGQRLYS